MGAKAAVRDVEVVAGWDPAVPGIVWANKNPGSDNSSATQSHPFVPASNRFKPCLEPDRRSNADLIILPIKEILTTGRTVVIAALLAVQVIYSSAHPSGN